MQPEKPQPIRSRLFRSKKLDSLVEIAMSVGHNIRNPVTIIGGLSRRMYRDLPEDDPKRQFFQIILTEVSRLENIVDEFNRFYSIKQMSFLCQSNPPTPSIFSFTISGRRCSSAHRHIERLKLILRSFDSAPE